MDWVVIVILGLGFFATTIALVAIAYRQPDVAETATRLLGEGQKAICQKTGKK